MSVQIASTVRKPSQHEAFPPGQSVGSTLNARMNRMAFWASSPQTQKKNTMGKDGYVRLLWQDMTRYDKTRYSMTSSNKDCRKAAIACTQIHCAETPTKVHAHTRSSRPACAPRCPHIPHSTKAMESWRVCFRFAYLQPCRTRRSYLKTFRGPWWVELSLLQPEQVKSLLVSPREPTAESQKCRDHVTKKYQQNLTKPRNLTAQKLANPSGDSLGNGKLSASISIDQHRSALAWSSSWAWQSVASWTSYTSHTSHTSYTSYTSYTRRTEVLCSREGLEQRKIFGIGVLFQFALAQCSRGRWSQQLFESNKPMPP